ncbi:hypothetical protein NAL19_2094 [Pectobacterium sp. F1-1]|nr:hypothetical protein KKH3_18830 [Pectobacterium actinidiae]UYA60247.1 hypothetical protein NAL19_2094 [Pectobacterium sp. F1-1]
MGCEFNKNEIMFYLFLEGRHGFAYFMFLLVLMWLKCRNP